jgi:hypothetical protein
MPSDKQLDEAIDRAVRELMSLDPPAGLRARVLARIERPAAWWMAPRAVASVGLAAALLLLALVLARREPEHVPDVRIAATAETSRPDPVRPERTTVNPPPAVAQPYDTTRAVSGARRRREDQQVEAASLAPATVPGLAELEPLAAIAIDRVETLTIEAGDMAVPPLTAMVPLTVQPLPPPDGRN